MYKDTRLRGVEKWYHKPPEDVNMRIPNDLLKSVCFLCVKIQKGKNAGRFQYFGTAFFVGIREEDWTFTYLVTARHVIDEARRVGHKTLFVRVNKHDGGAENIELGSLDNWASFVDESIDMAILGFAPNINEFDYKFVPESILVTPEEMDARGIGEGDELVAIGLFTLHTGKHRNIPIVRTGVIAAMPYERFLDKKGREYSAFLAELRSIGGISGSPVFVYLDTRRVYDSKIGENEYQLLLLGIIRGHWDLRRELESDTEILIDDAVLGFSSGEKMNVGIAVVTPALYIGALLNSDFLRGGRKERMAMDDQENQITEDALLEKELSSEEFTQDMFQGSLRKASRKISEPVSERKETSE